MDAATKKSRATRAKTNEQQQEQTQILENTTKKTRRKTGQKNEAQSIETNGSEAAAAPAAQDQPDGAADKNPKIEFGAWLRRERESKGLTQASTAQAVGIHVNQLARIEKGASGSKQATVAAFAKALALDEAEVLRRAGFTDTVAKPAAEEATSKTNGNKTNGRTAKIARARKLPKQPIEQPENGIEQQPEQQLEPQAEQPKANNYLDRETMLAIYRTMYLARKVDDKEIQLKNQN
jgi:transcriptional regulator with XRE-family HTH domain